VNRREKAASGSPRGLLAAGEAPKSRYALEDAEAGAWRQAPSANSLNLDNEVCLIE
jgi:hypothetical protein